MSSTLEDDFKKLREKVLIKRPVLHEILKKRGKRKLFEYAKLYIDVNLNPPIQKRQNELLCTFEKEVAENLGEDVAKAAVKQLKNYYFISTVDHHSPLYSHFWINGNLLTAAPYFEKNDPDLKYVMVFACSNVSLNNISYPRGLLFNTYAQGKIEQQRLSFFPASDRLCPVYNFRAYTKEDVERMRKVLAGLVRDGKVHSEEAGKVNELLETIYLRPEILAAKNYSDQITKSNFILWKKFFESSQVSPPNIIYLAIENLVNRLLLENHIDQDSIITHFLFDEKYDPLIYKHFEGISGCFSREEQWGTFHFWGLPKGAKYRVQMWKEGNYLVSSDKSFKVELTPAAIRKAIVENELIPSMMLCYIILAFYYGLKCLGGFSQVNYLTFMKNAYIKMQVDLGNYRSIEVCARSQTKEMGGDYTIAFSGGPNGEMVPSTGLDLILYGNKDTWSRIVSESKDVTLNEGINPLMPGFYRVLYPEPEREEALLNITAEDISKLTGLDKKIKPCVEIKVH